MNKASLYTCSPGEPGNEASSGRELCSSAHQESLGTRLSMGLHSVVVLIREPGNKASQGIVLCIGTHQGSLGTRLALGFYTPPWSFPGEPGMRLAQCCTGAHQGSLGTRLALGLYSILVLTVLIRRTSNSFCFRR